MNPCQILVVEDESIVSMDIGEPLAGMGYVPAGWTSSGEEALALAAAAGRPDLVLMDICLQGDMDGIAAAEEDANVAQRTRPPRTGLVGAPTPASATCP